MSVAVCDGLYRRQIPWTVRIQPVLVAIIIAVLMSWLLFHGVSWWAAVVFLVLILGLLLSACRWSTTWRECIPPLFLGVLALVTVCELLFATPSVVIVVVVATSLVAVLAVLIYLACIVQLWKCLQS